MKESQLQFLNYHCNKGYCPTLLLFDLHKGQLISKANCQVVNSSKKRTNEFVFTTMRRVFVRFWKKLKTHKKSFCNQLTFSKRSIVFLLSLFSRISSSSSSLSLFALFYLAHFDKKNHTYRKRKYRQILEKSAQCAM